MNLSDLVELREQFFDQRQKEVRKLQSISSRAQGALANEAVKAALLEELKALEEKKEELNQEIRQRVDQAKTADISHLPEREQRLYRMILSSIDYA